jgi:SAM-dependent methyltransferase
MKKIQRKISYFEYHLKQYQQPYRSTLAAINFLKKRIPNQPFKILDVGCGGGGANIYWLKKYFPKWKIIGIDIDQKVLKIAKKMNKEIEGVEFKKINFLKADFKEKFDYIFAIQFISFVNFDFPIFLKKALNLTRRGIFLTALFSEGWIEQYTTALDLKENWKGTYKIYSLERFKETLKKIGGRNVILEYEKFDIDIDLPRPVQPKFGTYTVKIENGKRLQISGYMLMPWYNVLIKII